MNVIFISPHFPTYYYNFCDRLKERGANVFGIGDAPYETLSENTKSSLTEYYYVSSLENYEEVYKATAYFAYKYGKIDWIESENEYWLILEARLRTDFNVNTGPKADEMDSLRWKSKMKAVYKKAGVKVADYTLPETVEDGLAFTKKNGYPVIVKPDNGMGASDTHKLKNDEELKAFFESKDPNVTYIMEDYIPGQVETFEGITDDKRNIFIATSHVMVNQVMDSVNDRQEALFYSQPVKDTDIYEIGAKTVKAFNSNSRFFHFEFMRLLEDKKGLGKKGDLLGLEVNMRAPGAYIPDMMNFCYDVDVYTIWADMLLYNECYYDIKRKYYVAYVGRHPEFDYVLSYDDVRERYGDKIVIDTDVPAALAEAMGSHVFIYRTKTKKEMNSIMQAIAQRR